MHQNIRQRIVLNKNKRLRYNTLTFYYIIILKINNIVTPGMPATAEIPILNKLIGRVTLVNVPSRLTAKRENVPVKIPDIAFLTGLFALTSI